MRATSCSGGQGYGRDVSERRQVARSTATLWLCGAHVSKARQEGGQRCAAAMRSRRREMVILTSSQ